MTERDPHATPPLPSKSVLDDVVDLRRHFHKHPEISFSEQETSLYLRERLRELGLDLKTCPTETGAVAMLDTGRPGKTVMLRADIDALPIHDYEQIEKYPEERLRELGLDLKTCPTETE